MIGLLIRGAITLSFLIMLSVMTICMCLALYMLITDFKNRR